MKPIIFISSITLFSPYLIFSATPNPVDDFSIALKNYEQGEYYISQIFFEQFINNNPYDTLIPEATHYLLKIYDQHNDLLKFVSRANSYLESFKYDKKREEVFNLLLKKLVEQNTFHLAYEYIQKYDYISVDTLLLSKIILNLSTQTFFIDKFLQTFPENESLKILKALTIKDLNERKQIFQTIKKPKGGLYLIENYLLMGDTVSAWEEYQSIKLNEVPDNMLYRWAMFAIIFNENDLKKILSRLETAPELKEKKKILNMFIEKKLLDSISIQQDQDLKFVQKFFSIRHIDSTQLLIPENINMDSILNDTSNIEDNLLILRQQIKSNYKLDSIYCELLIKKQAYAEAYNVIKDYLKYPETRNFSRMTRVLKNYAENNFKMALNDLIFCLNSDPYIKFIYAECLKQTGHNPVPVYEELLASCRDSLIRFQSLSEYIKYKYNKNDYPAITKIVFQDIENDTNLAKFYLLSLVRTGKTAKAETLYKKIFGNLDLDFHIARINYLMENKLWKRATILLDSLVKIPEYQGNHILNYNSALVAFCTENYAYAETCFHNFISRFKNNKYYYPALFKIGTLKYLKQSFDSAAYYYGLAAKDSILLIEALQNQLLALKKSERWAELIDVGQILINICPDSIKSDYYFEIGYACLRAGLINQAIKNLKTAISLKSNVNYYYWLGEAYLGKGDFQRALYHYQKIVYNFRKDEMWYPTVLFKTGLALEMLDEMKEAKEIYRRIIRERGTGDIWGNEAQKRLKLLR